LYKQLNSGLHFDAAAQTAVFDDIDSAIHFRSRFPWWEVRCLIILPRCQLPTSKPNSPTPPTTSYTSWGMINLHHPLLTVPATADILGLWQENGRFIGLELCFPDGHHTYLTFQEIEELQHDDH
jgi:hypothetical protein